VFRKAATIMAVSVVAEAWIERNGHRVPGSEHLVDAAPDDRSKLAGLLEGWLSGQRWDPRLWGEFTIVTMDGLRRVAVRTDGRQP
jgi:hypothetical protein